MIHDHPLKADLLLVLVTLLAAAGWVFSLLALRGLPPLLFIGVRFVMAGALLGAIGWPALIRFDVGNAQRAAATGVVMGLSMLCWIKGLQQTDNMGVGAFICTLGNILAPVVGWLLFKVRIGRMTWVAVMIAAVGMACLSLRGDARFSAADLYFLGSAISSSLYLNLNSRFAARIAVLPLAAIQLTVVGGLSLAVSAVCEHWPTAIGGETVGWLMTSVLVATSLRFFLQVKGQGLAPISHSALILNLEPVWAALIAATWLGATMSGMQLLGCVLIFVALLLNRLPWRQMRWRRLVDHPEG
jgi:drug/metabolite transporter (DMT)-like permease